MELKYRPEIDGLRTIAVLSVIIYHAEIFFGDRQLLKGGFLGVDVFFVISGFLITSIIMSEYQRTGKFSLTNFYERRARRLLPALFIVILASLPFAWDLLLPTALVDFSKSILSTIVFGSNFYWDQTLQVYGAESVLLKPFLHTWSLAVEEQYYIIYPLLLIALHRWFKSYTIILLSAGLLLSLQFAETMTTRDASFSFYLLPSRFWELLAGGLLSNIMFLHPQKHSHSLLNQTMPALGLVLIFLSMIFIDINSHHPGYVTLIPVIGTMLIIWFTNGKDLVTKFLSTKLFVGIGVISYSLYLWHYPIFAFGRYLDSVPTWHDKTLWIALTFILSVVTYFLIEKPFRNKKKISRKSLLSWLVITLVIIISITYYWSANNGFESRLGYLKTVLKNSERVWVNNGEKRCQSGGRDNRGKKQPQFLLSKSCVFINNTNAKYIIAVGDSHAAALSENLRLLAKENNVNFMQVTNAGCTHVKGIFRRGTCFQRTNQLMNFLSNYPGSIIVYSARIPLLLELEKFDNHEGNKEKNFRTFPKGYINSQRTIRTKALINTLNELKENNEKLIIVYPVPEQGFPVKRKLFANKKLINTNEDLPLLTTSYDVFKTRVKTSYQALDKVTDNNVLRIYPETIFCHEQTGRCVVSNKDKIYFSIDNHVSPLGSSLIINKIAQELKLHTSTLPDTHK